MSIKETKNRFARVSIFYDLYNHRSSTFKTTELMLAFSWVLCAHVCLNKLSIKLHFNISPAILQQKISPKDPLTATRGLIPHKSSRLGVNQWNNKQSS